MLRDNATHTHRSLIANLEYTMNVHQHKPRAQHVNRGFCHYFLINDYSKHDILTFLS
jgi:hypothetical protein